MTTLAELVQKANEPWYRIENAAKDGERTRATVHIFDAIGGWFGIRAADLVRAINELDVDDIELHLNSPGGLVHDGVAIMNSLRQHRADIEVHVDGLAASIASIIAMAGDTIIMSRGSQMMIHDPSVISWGNAATLRKDADILDKIGENLSGIYAARAGGKPEDWRALMLAETWYNADEAVAAGLADRTDDTAAEPTARFDLSIFAHAGRSAAPPPLDRYASLAAMATPIPPATEPGQTTNQKEGLMPKLSDGLRERLGITDAELDEDGLLAALDERLTATATTAPPEGTVLVDKAAFEALQSDAQAGRTAHDQLVAQRREQVIVDAMAKGRIAAASRDHFRAMLDKDEETATALIASLPENTVPVVELGTQSGPSADDQIYDTLYPGEDA